MIWHKPTQSFSSSDNFFKILWNDALKDEKDKLKLKNEFNKNWNYFSGMNDDQVMDFLKSDMTWHNPTQSFSSSDNFFKVLWNTTLKDELDKEKINGDYNHMRQFKFDHKDIKAFGILGVSVGLKWKKIQDKFKLLVKKFHPDMNSGNKKYEEKLKLITLAYTQLKNTYREKIDTKS